MPCALLEAAAAASRRGARPRCCSARPAASVEQHQLQGHARAVAQPARLPHGAEAALVEGLVAIGRVSPTCHGLSAVRQHLTAPAIGSAVRRRRCRSSSSCRSAHRSPRTSSAPKPASTLRRQHEAALPVRPAAAGNACAARARDDVVGERRAGAAREPHGDGRRPSKRLPCSMTLADGAGARRRRARADRLDQLDRAALPRHADRRRRPGSLGRGSIRMPETRPPSIPPARDGHPRRLRSRPAGGT